ncbi:hypothetical protein ATCCBAA256_33370 [Mycobacterium montefiorense]|nr:hypothetical protein ATCCBAA256_33370 [Mycobacterium montefiorense]
MLIGIQQLDRGKRAAGVGCDGFEYPLEPLHQSLDAAAIEHVGTVFHRPGDSRRLAGPGVALNQ